MVSERYLVSLSRCVVVFSCVWLIVVFVFLVGFWFWWVVFCVWGFWLVVCGFWVLFWGVFCLKWLRFGGFVFGGVFVWLCGFGWFSVGFSKF